MDAVFCFVSLCSVSFSRRTYSFCFRRFSPTFVFVALVLAHVRFRSRLFSFTVVFVHVCFWLRPFSPTFVFVHVCFRVFSRNYDYFSVRAETCNVKHSHNHFGWNLYRQQTTGRLPWAKGFHMPCGG